MSDSTATATLITGTVITATLDGDSMDNFSFHAGNDHTRTVTVQVSDSTQPSGFAPVDLSGASCLLTVRKAATDPDPLLALVGVLAADPTTGVVDFFFQTRDTAGIAPGLYIYDVDVTLASGNSYTALGGVLELEATATQPGERRSVEQVSQVVTLTSVAAYPGTAQVILAFTPDTLLVQVVSGTPGVKVSFDGTHDHMHVKPGAQPVPVPSNITSIWLREDAAGVSTARVTAIASS